MLHQRRPVRRMIGFEPHVSWIRGDAFADERAVAPTTILDRPSSQDDVSKTPKRLAVRQSIQRQLRSQWPTRPSIEPLSRRVRVAEFVIDQEIAAVAEIIDPVWLQRDGESTDGVRLGVLGQPQR